MVVSFVQRPPSMRLRPRDPLQNKSANRSCLSRHGYSRGLLRSQSGPNSPRRDIACDSGPRFAHSPQKTSTDNT